MSFLEKENSASCQQNFFSVIDNGNTNNLYYSNNNSLTVGKVDTSGPPASGGSYFRSNSIDHCIQKLPSGGGDVVWSQQTMRPAVTSCVTGGERSSTNEFESSPLPFFPDYPLQNFNSHADPWAFSNLDGFGSRQTNNDCLGAGGFAPNDLFGASIDKKDPQMLDEISKLENLLSSSNEPLPAVDTNGQGSIITSGSSLSDQWFLKEERPRDVTGINEIISDVASILDEFQTTTQDSSKVGTGTGIQQIGNDQTDIDFLKPLTTDIVNSNLSKDSESFIDSLFRSPERFQGHNGINSNISAGHSSNQSLITKHHEASHKEIESESIFSDLITSKEEYISSQLNVRYPSNIGSFVTSNGTSTSLPDSSFQTSQLVKNAFDTTGIPKRVAFKVRPAGKTVRYVDKTRLLRKFLPGAPKEKNRPLKNELKDPSQGETGLEQFYEENLVSQNLVSNENFREGCVIPCRYVALSGTEMPATNNSTRNGDQSCKFENVVLPVGKTGLSVAIPNNVQTNVISFLPTVSQICKVKQPSVSSSSQAGLQHCSGTNNLNSCNRPLKSSVLRCIKPKVKTADMVLTSPTNENFGTLNQIIQQTILKNPNNVASSGNSSTMISIPSRLQIVNNVSVPQTTAYKPLYVVVPATSTQSIPKRANGTLSLNQCFSQTNTQTTESFNTFQLVKIDGKESKLMLKNRVRSNVQPIGPKLSANKSGQFQSSSGHEPVRITIRTKPKGNQEEYATGIKFGEGHCGHSSNFTGEERMLASGVNSKSTHNPVQKYRRNRHFVNELKVHFPTVPEAILQQLTIPSQALHRGYLTKNDLQNLHTQALKLHLNALYRNHVSKCSIYKCETCQDFVGQQNILQWTTRVKFIKPAKPCKNYKNKGPPKPRKQTKKCVRNKNVKNKEDDPTYEPPLSFLKSWKRKSESFWCSNPSVKLPKMESNFSAANSMNYYIPLGDSKLKMKTNQKPKNIMKRSSSEPRITRCPDSSAPKKIFHSKDDMSINYRKTSLEVERLPVPLIDLTEKVHENKVVEKPDPYKIVPGTTGMTEPKYQWHQKGGTTVESYPEMLQNISKNPYCTSQSGLNGNYVVAPNLQPTSVFGYPYMTKTSLESQMTLQPVHLGNEIQFSPALFLEEGCSCKGSCRTMQCPCARGGVLCRTGITCQCKDCNNPLNILHQYELDILIARVDECLMQNLYSFEIADLCKMLKSDIVLPCCGSILKLQNVIPSTVVCNRCGNAVSYSWCQRNVHLQTVYPRNHCLVCCSCRPAFHTHCQRCQRCTLSVNQGSCADCGVVKLFAV